MKLSTSLLAVAMLVAGCGGPSPHAAATPSANARGSPASSPSATAAASPASSPGASPTTSPAASPVPLTGAFAVLSTLPSGDSYTVSIVAANGKVVGSAQPSSPTAVTCGDAAAAVVPLPISTSDDRAYYMDAQGVVRFMTVQGETGRATTVPVGGGRRSMFAVSPDDQRIAVVVSDFTASGVSIRLYVEDLNGATNHVEIYTSNGAYGLWPIGWHGTDNLVVAKVPSCSQGGGQFCCGPLELHVVDPATAVRRFTLGGPDCVLAGPPSPAGAVCENNTFTVATIYNWTAVQTGGFPIGAPTSAYLSPDGQHVAVVSGSTTAIYRTNTTLSLQACGWIDSTHVISGGDVQQQPRIGNVSTGAVVPVAVQGTCAGRLPGGL
ncbi:MAG TPA: hypothetical protein VF956_09320 [Candidatus Dormibacteraeota bacterium]